MNQALSYIKKSYRELKNVVWPTPKTALGYTLIVILITLLVAALLGVSDYVFTLGLEQVV